GEAEFRLNEKATFGAIASLISDFRIPILFLKDSHQTALFIFSLAKREQEGKEVNVRIQTRKKPKDIKLLQRMIVESLPNVGPASAEQLLKTFHTVENIFTAPEPYLAKVVGAKKAEKIREVLEKWYD
ncbi:MAG: helix-hairpin-helix domain-containing protein, partial [archaeon]